MQAQIEWLKPCAGTPLTPAHARYVCALSKATQIRGRLGYFGSAICRRTQHRHLCYFVSLLRIRARLPAANHIRTLSLAWVALHSVTNAQMPIIGR